MLGCGAAEALMAARGAGAITPDGAARLRDHLAGCASCTQVAATLDAPGLADALIGAAELEHNFDQLAVVAPDTYVRGFEIGRGGMGQIVRARDRRLGRMVAIKELIDPRMHARFEHEARLTARLQHPAIVTIYEAGRWPNGEPFYAMKYVAGQPLDQVIAGLGRLDDRLALLANLIAVVEAIAYAHSEGVVHRDLKPHNVLIGPFGETVVIDWGLAKDLKATDPGAPFRGDAGGFTQGGAGTPSYMAPEQALGAPPDERIDVYALGATLHHVLAGDRPDLCPLPEATPSDLRAIVAKATAADPADRYPTAAELAGELKRFQNGQLVAAHRYTTGELVRRWLRRHRGVVAVTAIALAILAAGATLGVLRIVAERDRANAQRRLAEAQHQVADAQRKGAERLVDYMLGTLRDRLEPIGKLELLAGIGKQVEGYFASVPAGDEADVDVLRQRAGGLILLAEIDFKQARFDDARLEYQRALTLCRRREPLAPSSNVAACTAQALHGLARAERHLGMTSGYRDRLTEAAAGLDRALARDPGDVALRRLRAIAAYHLGHEQENRGALADARATLGTGVPLAEHLVADDPRDARSAAVLAQLMTSLCHVESLDGHPEAARPVCARLLEVSERSFEPDAAPLDLVAARATVNVADVENQLGDWRAARVRLAAKLAVIRRLMLRDPSNVATLELFADLGLSACDNLVAASDPRPDPRVCLDAVASYEVTLHNAPTDDVMAANLASAEASLAAVALARRELGVAQTATARALELAEEWRTSHANDPMWSQVLSTARWRRAAVLHALGDAAGARAMAAAAVAILTGSDAKQDDFLVELAYLRAELVRCELAADDAALRPLIVRLERAVERWPHVVEIQAKLALALVLEANARAPAESRALRARALRLVVVLERNDTLGLEYRALRARAR